MKLAVIGAGHGGYTIAASSVLRGHEVCLYEMPRFKHNLDPILERGGIELFGADREGFAKIENITTDIGKAIRGVKVIMVCTNSNAHKTIAELCAPYLQDGQIIMLLPGNLGSLEFAKIYKDKGIKIHEKDIKIAETPTLPYACRRVIGQARTKINLPTTELAVSAFPAKDTHKVINDLESLKGILDLYPGRNVIEVGLSNPNITGHVAGTILNTGYIEASGGDFKLWKQGMSPSVLRGIQAVFKEKDAIFKKLGGYKDYYPFEALEEVLASPTFIESWGPPDMKFRYITEDTPNGMVSLASLGNMIGVPTPVIRSFITIASVINEADYWKEGRAVERLGISGLSVEELNRYLENGEL